MTSSTFLIRSLALAVGLCGSLSAQQPPKDAAGPSTQTTAQVKVKDEGSTIIITYRCPAAKRAAFRQQMLSAGVPRFEKWKRDGIVDSYHLLFDSYVDADTWDMMTIVSVRDTKQLERWTNVERTMPGGMSSQDLALGEPVNTYIMDRVWSGGSGDNSRPTDPSVFFVIPYTYSPTSVADYTKYAQGYVIPQVVGWTKEGIIRNYGIYLNRYPAGRATQVLFVIEYKSAEAFALRDETTTKVRAQLRLDPAWKTWSDNKLEIRKEKEATIAEELLAK
jgi:hypothetical protein